MMAKKSSVALSEAPPSAKARQILSAAREVFMAEGYGAASMDAIARAAGVSKATLYAHFAGKEDLFAAIVAAECERHAEVLSATDVDRLEVRAALVLIGRSFLDLILSPQALAIYRVVVAESGRFPELGRAFYASGPSRVLTRLAAYLGRVTEQGALSVPDPLLAAEQFIGMTRGAAYLRRLLGVAVGASEPDPGTVVDSAVEVFMRAYAPDPRAE